MITKLLIDSFELLLFPNYLIVIISNAIQSELDHR